MKNFWHPYISWKSGIINPKNDWEKYNLKGNVKKVIEKQFTAKGRKWERKKVQLNELSISEFDNHGNEIEYLIYDSNESIKLKLYCNTNNNGRKIEWCLEKCEIPGLKDCECKVAFEYDDKGNETTNDVFWLDGSHYGRFGFTYSDDGKIINKTLHLNNHDRILETFGYKENTIIANSYDLGALGGIDIYEYNEYWNITEIISYHAQGGAGRDCFTPNKNGSYIDIIASRKTFQYDTEQNATLIKYYIAGGQELFSEYRLEFDSRGNVIRQINFESDVNIPEYVTEYEIEYFND